MIAVATIIFTPMQRAQAQGINIDTGNGFLETCGADGPAFMKSECTAYVKGLFEGLESGEFAAQLEAGLKSSRTAVCRPDGVTTRQAQDVVLAFLQKNPANRQNATSLLATVAWKDAWPCKPTD